MKDTLINKIVEIIKDYRSEDLKDSNYNYTIDYDHVLKWILQFNEDDREFILSELLHLLPFSYLTKENTLRILSDFEVYTNYLNYKTVQDFLSETKFLDCQESGKSQKILNGMINEALQLKYNYNINDCGNRQVKNWFYVDDVLASGKTFKDDIINGIKDYGIDKFKAENIQIIAPFIILHQWGRNNVLFSIEKEIGIKLKSNLHFFHVRMIENNPHINYFNKSPKFNHVYPKESEFGYEVLEFVENSCGISYEMKNSNFAFRNLSFPVEENFFSNSVNRIRYENILLEKGFEIMNRIETIRVPSLRPLGMTPPSYKTLGTGSHIITWRNISNTCPLVFWWDANDWYPLFARKH
ncbi:phosphoribosyltransferase-like protein [Chryseobacterium daecheongense]|uniref:PRTase-CE domain-containing protein n=1 Tax=Chryseobacterium daecheongense TaxID=192389 RepID=A0A3N0W3D5_9FLAO|nr:hypothetical protein [Chryseobacterium daecheongense]ROH99557.1 hypothetical protein EGI05_01305 [Chryseobacterium daecheongense]TDX95536.1 hypothetical protein BCF50_1315 [Chryseobacterium daecheongense]